MSRLGGQSVTLRLTLLFAAVSTTALLLLGLLAGTLAERHFEELDAEVLDGRLALIRHTLAGVDSPAARGDLSALLDHALVGQHGLSVAIWDEKGAALYLRSDPDFPPALQDGAPTPGEVPLRWSSADGRQFRGSAEAMPLGLPGQPPLRVAVATDLAHHQHFMHSFQRALWSFVALAALLSGLLGWVAARRGLAPLRAICRDAAEITATRLYQRLPDEAIPSELAEVARTLNDMLARLEESFRRLSDFSSDLAHELRTPVSNLLTQTQVTLSRARSVAEYQEVLASNAEEFERLSRMIADMLFLAKADNDLVIPHQEEVDLGREVAGLAEFYEALAEEQGIRLTVEGTARVQGDRLMLRRAIGNLLSNAFAHTPPGGTITVRLSEGSDGPAVAVENSGETIPPEHLPRLFDRFYRADPARQRLGDGVGLGLAITRSIARAHGGEVAVASGNGRSTFTIRLGAPGHRS